MRIDVLTLFPDMFTGVLGASILKRAAEKKLVEYAVHDIRKYTTDPHRKVDEKPFGGGPGMVMMCQPVIDAVAAVDKLIDVPPVRIMTDPGGERLTQGLCEELSVLPRVMLIAGHYEGYDERIRQILKPREISVGDYVLSGGELPAMIIMDAIVRLIPGVLGDEMSNHGESFGKADSVIKGGLEYPHYTRPREFMGLSVPDVLLSGNHAAIAAWREREARQRTAEKRPDLLEPGEELEP